MDLIADTTLLVGLWRRQSWALDFARRNSGKSLGVPWIVLGEFWHGARRAGHDPAAVTAFLSIGLPILEPGPVIPVYAELCARAQAMPKFREIGQNDLWIAAVCLAHNKALVSRNRRHFDLVDHLKIEVLEGP